MMKWTENTSDLCKSFFKKVLENVHYLNNKGNLNNEHIPTLLINNNKYFSLIINSSEGIFKDVIFQ